MCNGKSPPTPVFARLRHSHVMVGSNDFGASPSLPSNRDMQRGGHCLRSDGNMPERHFIRIAKCGPSFPWLHPPLAKSAQQSHHHCPGLISACSDPPAGALVRAKASRIRPEGLSALSPLSHQELKKPNFQSQPGITTRSYSNL